VTRSLGAFGVWARGAAASPELAAELEALGYGALWIGGSPRADLARSEQLLGATDELVVATGIVNIWASPADEVARSYHRIAARYPARFLLGIGVGHPEATGDRYRRPYEALVEYLDALDGAGVPKDDLALAALGPKVLRLAAERTAGAHPYLTTPEHTRSARELLGAGPLIAPEQHVVLDVDPERARALARPSWRVCASTWISVPTTSACSFSSGPAPTRCPATAASPRLSRPPPNPVADRARPGGPYPHGYRSTRIA
jgi:probable F420-dependent oxidoreductase